MSADYAITITPPLTLEEMKSFGEFRTVHCYPAETGGAGSLLPNEGVNYYPHWMRQHLQDIVDHFPGHEFTGFIEARNSAAGQPPITRYAMRGRNVVRLDPVIGWPPEQADDSEDGLMEILADPDSIVSVTQQCAGYATDVWETVPADDTNLPERLLAWRDVAVRRALIAACEEI